MLSAISFVTVGVLWALMFADAALTLHGLKSGLLREKNRLVIWFTKTQARLYSLTVAASALAFWATWGLLRSPYPWSGAIVCVPALVFRGIVVVHNYKLNVWHSRNSGDAGHDGTDRANWAPWPYGPDWNRNTRSDRSFRTYRTERRNR